MVDSTLALFLRHVWHAWVTALIRFVRTLVLNQADLEEWAAELAGVLPDFPPLTGAGWMARKLAGGAIVRGRGPEGLCLVTRYQ